MLCSHAAGGEFIDSFDGKFDASGYLSDNAYGFLPVPIIITEPALGGFGLGFVGIFFHETEEQRDQRRDAARKSEDAARYLMPPSASAVLGLYTANGSWMTGAGHMAIWKQDNIRYKVGAGYGSINLDFYGAGGFEFNTPLELKNEGSFFYQEIKFRIAGSKVLLGLQQKLTGIKVEPKNLQESIGGILPPKVEDRLIPILDDLISTDDTMSGIGLVAEWDNRDNMFNPHKGYNYKLDYLWYDDRIGSDFDYSEVTLKGLNYWKLGDSFRAGLRLSGHAVDSEGLLPFYAIPFVQLRGIPAMRYQGEYVAVGEVELTWQANLRWSVLGFAGAGRTAESFDELDDGPSYVSRGLGFRYLIARRYGMSMGIDIARGPEDTVFYIQAGSSW